MKPEIKALDYRTVQMILSHLTQELRQDIPEAETQAVQTEQEARMAIASLLTETKSSAASPADIVPADSDAERTARETLEIFLEDPVLAPKVRALLADPPRDSQMSVELAISSAIVLGALISWLQTKLQLKVSRKAGKTDFEFELKKQGASNSVIKQVANVVKNALFLK
jgi:hypothetical protein